MSRKQARNVSSFNRCNLRCCEALHHLRCSQSRCLARGQGNNLVGGQALFELPCGQGNDLVSGQGGHLCCDERCNVTGFDRRELGRAQPLSNLRSGQRLHLGGRQTYQLIGSQALPHLGGCQGCDVGRCQGHDVLRLHRCNLRGAQAKLYLCRCQGCRLGGCQDHHLGGCQAQAHLFGGQCGDLLGGQKVLLLRFGLGGSQSIERRPIKRGNAGGGQRRNLRRTQAPAHMARAERIHLVGCQCRNGCRAQGSDLAGGQAVGDLCPRQALGNLRRCQRRNLICRERPDITCFHDGYLGSAQANGDLRRGQSRGLCRRQSHHLLSGDALLQLGRSQGRNLAGGQAQANLGRGQHRESGGAQGGHLLSGQTLGKLRSAQCGHLGGRQNRHIKSFQSPQLGGREALADLRRGQRHHLRGGQAYQLIGSQAKPHLGSGQGRDLGGGEALGHLR